MCGAKDWEMKLKRIQRRRAKGWKMPANTVYVGRPTIYGNPFIVGRDGTREDCMKLYAMLAGGYVCLTSKATPADQNRASRGMQLSKRFLRGKNLACWCPVGQPCHADVLLKIANE